MTSKLELSLLGRVEIKRDGRPVTGFVSTKVQALLFYLALTGRPHHRETLTGLLWGDKPETRARGNLRKALSNLRQLLGEFVVITDYTVAFNSAGNYWFDVSAFEAGVATGFKPPNLPALREAAELYRGDFLGGFSVEQALAFEEWMLAERERLRHAAIQVLHHLAGAYTARGEYAAGIDVTARLLALEPWQEEAHRQLMTLLARSGQHGAALAQYETCRRILAEELGVEPLPETQALYERLKAKGRATPHNLPPPATPFVGREAELAQIAHTLDQSGCRLLSLIGLGGIGKTRLALQAAAEQLSMFKDGVFFVTLAGVSSPELVVTAIAKTIQCPLSGPGELHKQLINYLVPQEMLLILDNFEHLLAGPQIGLNRETLQEDSAGSVGLLLKILAGAPGLKLMVTSRERLNLQEEWVLEVGGLEFPAGHWTKRGKYNGPESPSTSDTPSPLLQLRPYSAIQLFVQHAQRVQVGFALSEANLNDIIRLCQLVHGMPLGLELAATWIPLLSCAEIVSEIERDLNFLTTSARNVPDRHRSMRAVFESSWDLLTAPEQAVFKKLSVFKGKFHREAAVQICGASLQLLLVLLNKALLQRDASGYYDLHELLRQYAAEKLANDTDPLAIQARHGQYYLAFLHERETRLQGGKQPETLKEISEALENIQVAWRWAIIGRHWAAIEQASRGLFLFCETHSRFQEGQALFQYAIDSLDPPPGGETGPPESVRLPVLGKLLAYQGRLLYNRGLYQLAWEALEKSRLISEQLDQLETRAFALHSLALIAVMQGEYAKARQLAHESRQQCQQLHDSWGEAWSLYTLGWAAYYLGEYDPAQNFTESSLRLHRRIGNRHGEAACLNTLGLIVCALYEYSLEQHPEAAEFFEQNLAIRRTIGDRWGEAIAMHNLGYIHCKLKQYDAAKKWFLDSLALSKIIGALNMVAATSMWLGVVTLEQQNYPEARAYLTESLKIGYNNGGLGRVTDTLFRLGDLWGRQGQTALAVEYLAFVQQHPATDDRVRDGTKLLLAKLAAHLTPALMATAQAKGCNRNLDEVVAEALA